MIRFGHSFSRFPSETRKQFLGQQHVQRGLGGSKLPYILQNFFAILITNERGKRPSAFA